MVAPGLWRPGLVLGAAAAVCLGGLGFWAGVRSSASARRAGEAGGTVVPWSGHEEREPAGETEDVRFELGGIAASLARIEEAIAALDTRLASLEPVGARQPASPDPQADSGDLAASLADVQQRLQEALALLDGSVSLREVREKKPVTDLPELQRLLDLWRSNREEALKNVQLLSSEETMERFGPPTKIWTDEGNVMWLYGDGALDAATQKHEREVILGFVDGHVNQLSVHE